MDKIECKNCGELTPISPDFINIELRKGKIELEIHCYECEKTNWIWIDQDDLQADT
jgi:adenine-specific DNA methylase